MCSTNTTSPVHHLCLRICSSSPTLPSFDRPLALERASATRSQNRCAAVTSPWPRYTDSRASPSFRPVAGAGPAFPEGLNPLRTTHEHRVPNPAPVRHRLARGAGPEVPLDLPVPILEVLHDDPNAGVAALLANSLFTWGV